MSSHVPPNAGVENSRIRRMTTASSTKLDEIELPQSSVAVVLPILSGSTYIFVY